MRSLDPAAKLRGWRQLGPVVGQHLSTLGPGAFVLCDSYQSTAQAAFHVSGRPWTVYAGSRLTQNPRRMTQYDLRGRQPGGIDDPALIGRNAVYLGYDDPAIERAFARTVALDPVPITVNGWEVRRFRLRICYDFRGMPVGNHGPTH